MPREWWWWYYQETAKKTTKELAQRLPQKLPQDYPKHAKIDDDNVKMRLKNSYAVGLLGLRW